MKKLIMLVIVFGVLAVPIFAQAGFPLPPPPPPIFFSGGIEVIVIPDTYVYVCPDFEEDLFFYNGWWWRHWRSHWYRSRHCCREEWEYRSHAPRSVREIPPNWRFNYKHHTWGKDYRWDYRKIPQHELDRNWKGWKNTRHWEKHKPYHKSQSHGERGGKHK